MAVTEPIRDKKEFEALSKYFLDKGQFRNYVLVIMGVYTALRISDLLRLKWTDVYDGQRDEFRSHIAIMEQKTGKPKTIALNKRVSAALKILFPHRKGVFCLQANAIKTRQ